MANLIEEVDTTAHMVHNGSIRNQPQQLFIMTDQNERDCPTVYDVDGDVDLSLYDESQGGSDLFPRPSVGYGSSFSTRDDLTAWFAEWFESKEETKLFVDYLINKNLIQYESSISGFVITYKLYDQSDYWLECIEAFSAVNGLAGY